MAEQREPGRRGGGVEVLVVVALVVAGAAVRASQLGPSSLWLDDAWLALATKAEGLGELLMVGVTAPGFATALAGVVSLTGFSSTAAQALPFALGVAAAPVLYLAARRLGLGRGAALVGAALVLVAPVHVVYSGRVKPFTTDAVLAVAVLFRGWRVVEHPGDSRRWAWLALAAVASVMVSAAVATSVAGAYLAGLGAAAARSERSRDLRAALASVAAFAAFAVVWWLAVLRPASTPSLRAYWADHYLDLGAGPGGAAADLAAAVTGVVDGFSALPLTVFGLLLGYCVVRVGVRRPLLAVLLLAPLVVSAVLAALELAPLGGGRTDIHLYPALALLVALGVHLTVTTTPAPGAWAVPAVVLLAVAASVRLPPPYPEEDLRPLVALVEAEARPDDAIAVYSASRWGHALYTDGPVDLRPDPTSANGFTAVATDPRVSVLGPHRHVASRYEPEVEAIAAEHDRVWLLSSHIRADFAVLEQYLRDRGYQDARTEQRPGASVTLWTRAPPPPG